MSFLSYEYDWIRLENERESNFVVYLYKIVLSRKKRKTENSMIHGDREEWRKKNEYEGLFDKS